MKSELSVLSELQFYKKFQVHSKAASYIGKLPNSCVNVSTGLWSSVKPSWEALGQLLSRKRKSWPCAFQEMEALLASQGSSSSRTLADRIVEAKRPMETERGGKWGCFGGLNSDSYKSKASSQSRKLEATLASTACSRVTCMRTFLHMCPGPDHI